MAETLEGSQQPAERISSSELSQMKEWLSGIVDDRAKREALLELRDDRAQSCIDGLNHFISDPEIRGSAGPRLLEHATIILRRLCETSELYPTCYGLSDIHDISPKSAGGFCDIFQGRFKTQFVCLKVARLYKDSDIKRLLKAHAREAMLWNQLDHPNVVPFYGIFYWEKRICLVSPWMENGDIVEYLGKRPEAPRKPFVDDIAKGLRYLHDQNIVHGDLKGRNVLIDDRHRACLADFGLSTIVANGTLGFTRTASSTSGHTARWASPELFREQGSPTRESDVWAFGCICYEVLSGLEPFTGFSDYQVIFKLIKGELPARLDDVRLHSDEHLNDKFRDLIGGCWSIEIERRPLSAGIVKQLEADSLGRPSARDSKETLKQFWLNHSGTTSDLSQLKDLLGQVYHGNEVDSVSDIDDPLKVEGSFPPSKRSSHTTSTPPSSRLRRSSSAYLFSPRSSSPCPQDDNGTDHSSGFGASPAPYTQPLQQSASDEDTSASPLSDSGEPFEPQSPPSPEQTSGSFFANAHNFLIPNPSFIESSFTVMNNNSEHFMKMLFEQTILGAEFDSSARDPPPRCHPGTRLTIFERCIYFITTCDGAKKIRWVVGAAGVGKSAVMQSVAEFPGLPVCSHASVFFSIYGRDDATRTIITISYQFAARSAPYRMVIQEVITHDPSLLRSSMAAQFKKLIVEPFIHDPRLNSAGRFLVILDGLDECNNLRSQQQLLRLISDFCLTYPSSPLVWFISSRPETHITSFFSRSHVILAYEMEEIPVDSHEAREDVELFLRDELTEIRVESGLIDLQWPKERDVWKLTNAAGGLFAYASSAIRYIGDPRIRTPVTLLTDMMNVIDGYPITGVSQDEHPLASLDVLYARILSTIPLKTMINTRKLLLALASDWNFALKDDRGNFIVLGNWLAMTGDEAYAALNRLPSVLYIPQRGNSHEDLPRPLHKSFIDYISDPTRSNFCRDIEHEAQQLKIECASRILKEVPDGISMGDVENQFHYGSLTRGSSAGDSISLTWPDEEGGSRFDHTMTLSMYKLAVGEIVAGLKHQDPIFQSDSHIRLLTTRFESYSDSFPRDELRDLVFDESRRLNFLERGILRHIPLEVVKTPRSIKVKVRFCRPVIAGGNTYPWNSSCQHERIGEWEKNKDQNWTTEYHQRDCEHCTQRFKHQLSDWKVRSPDRIAIVLFTSTGQCCVEVQFSDAEESEWTYWFWCRIPLEERENHGSLV